AHAPGGRGRDRLAKAGETNDGGGRSTEPTDYRLDTARPKMDELDDLREGRRRDVERRSRRLGGAGRFKQVGRVTYGSLISKGGIGNPRTSFSYKSGGRFQSSRRRACTSVSGDNRAWVCPLISTTLTLIVFMALSSSSALGRSVLRPGWPA